jgi:predicted house-cleaning noncanonical NTP pyrophosphatase (MazG superfamily)
MPKFQLSKLVRDKLLDSYVELNQKPDYSLLDKEAHVDALIDKVIEETQEILSVPPEKRASEIADVREVLDSLTRVLGISEEEVQAAQDKKRAKAGSFDRGIFIRTLDLEDDDEEWITYYRREPKRYPES